MGPQKRGRCRQVVAIRRLLLAQFWLLSESNHQFQNNNKCVLTMIYSVKSTISMGNWVHYQTSERFLTPVSANLQWLPFKTLILLAQPPLNNEHLPVMNTFFGPEGDCWSKQMQNAMKWRYCDNLHHHHHWQWIGCWCRYKKQQEFPNLIGIKVEPGWPQGQPLLFCQESISSTFYEFFVQKFVQSQTLNREKLLNSFLYKKCARKMLMKLTPGVYIFWAIVWFTPLQNVPLG